MNALKGQFTAEVYLKGINFIPVFPVFPGVAPVDILHRDVGNNMINQHAKKKYLPSLRFFFRHDQRCNKHTMLHSV